MTFNQWDDTTTGMIPRGLLDDDDSSEDENIGAYLERETFEGATATRNFPSAGSVGHFDGVCRPCAWEPKPGGCSKADSCNFCHLCEEGELKKRKKQRIVALRESKAKKKLERSKLGMIPPGPVPPNLLMAKPPGKVIRELPILEDETSKEKTFHVLESFLTAIPRSNGRKEKEHSGDDSESTTTSSDKEAVSIPFPSNLMNGGYHNETPMPEQHQVPMPIVLCRDIQGSLCLSPLRNSKKNKITSELLGRHK